MFHYCRSQSMNFACHLQSAHISIGLLWRSGYENGFLKAPIYPDVFPAIHAWVKEKGLRVMIYSSGSVAAQKLFARYTNIIGLENGDLTPYLSGFYDTVNAGMKQDPESYRSIAEDTHIEPQQWLFLSDSVKGMLEISGLHSFLSMGTTFWVTEV